MNVPPQPEVRPVRRRRQWLARLVAGGALLLSLLLTVGLALLANLENPLVRDPLRSFLAEKLSLEVQYARFSLRDLTSLSVRQLDVATPGALRAFAPKLLELRALDASWKPGASLRQGLTIDRLTVEGLTLTVVMDDKGHTSLDPLLGDDKDESVSALSKSLEALPQVLNIDDFAFTDVVLRLIQVKNGQPFRQLTLSGLELAVEARAPTTSLGPTPVAGQPSPKSNSQPVLTAYLGSPRAAGQAARGQGTASQTVRPSRAACLPGPLAPAAGSPTSLTLETFGPEGARLQTVQTRLETQVELTRPAPDEQVVSVDLWLDLIRQELLSTPLPAGPVLDLQAVAHFQPGQSRTQAQVNTLCLMQNTLEGGLQASLEDRPDGAFQPTLTTGFLALYPDVLARLGLLPAGVGLSAEALAEDETAKDAGSKKETPEDAPAGASRLRLELSELVLDAADFMPLQGKARLVGALPWAGQKRPGSLARGEAITVDAQAQVVERLTLSLDGGLKAGELVYRAGGTRGRLSGVEVRLGSSRLVLSLEDLLTSVGQLELALKARNGQGAVAGYVLPLLAASGEARLNLPGSGPLALTGSLELPRLQVRQGKGGLARLGGSRVELALTEVVPDLAQPMRSQAQVKLSGWVGGSRGVLKVQQAPAQTGFQVEGEVRGLGQLQPLLAPFLPAGHRLAWGRLRGRLQGEGTLRGLVEGSLGGEARLGGRLEGLAYGVEGTRLGVRRGRLNLTLGGTPDRPEGTLGLVAEGVLVNGKALGAPLSLDLTARAGLKVPSVALNLSGGSGKKNRFEGQLTASAGGVAPLMRLDGRLAARVDSRLAALLGLLELGLEPVEGRPLSLVLRGEGQLEGLLKRGKEGLELAARPLRHLDGKLKGTLETDGLAWREGELALRPEKLAGVLQASFAGGAMRADATLKLPGLTVLSGADRLGMERSSHRLTVRSLGPLEEGNLRLSVRSRGEVLSQNLSTVVPEGDFRVEGEARVGRFSAVELERLLFQSQRLGSRLELRGVMDRAPGGAGRMEVLPEGGEGETVAQNPGGETLALVGSLVQDLEALDGAPGTFAGSGRLTVPFRLESPDLALFRLVSTLELRDVSLHAPGAKVSLKGAQGRCLLEEEFAWEGGSLRLLPKAERNEYVRASFPDTQPFLSGDSYFSLEEARYDAFVVGPLAGNLRVDRNVFRLDQLQAGAAEGTLAGQLLVDYLPGDTRVLFRGRASGLRLTEAREPLDGNMAVGFSWEKLDLNGQAHLIRVGRKTLLSLLDWLDPYREDADFNLVRQGLAVGYPDYVRLRFDHGLLSTKVGLGGAAAALNIQEIRGIALGPLLNRYLGEWLEGG